MCSDYFRQTGSCQGKLLLESVGLVESQERGVPDNRRAAGYLRAAGDGGMAGSSVRRRGLSCPGSGGVIESAIDHTLRRTSGQEGVYWPSFTGQPAR